ncbi:MAG: CPBP family intramembrane glutamic endopeptidase [Candidatus Bathyarchaeia archaeon]
MKREMLDAKPRSRIEVILLSMAIATLTFTEYAFAFIDPAIGIFSALISVSALYIALSIIREMNAAVRETVEIICLLQIYMLLISSLPWFFISQSLLIPATYSILLALCLWHIKESTLTWEELGFKKASIKHTIIAIAAAIPLGAIEYSILKPPPPTPAISISYLLQTAFYMFLFVGFIEELLFRGILMKNLEKYMSQKSALILQSLIFAILHLTWRSTWEVIFVFIAGIAFGLLFIKSKSLIPPTIAHGLGNTLLMGIFPYIS